MDNSKKRVIAFIVFTAFFILYFIWGLINKGYLSIDAEAPFSIEVVGEGTTECNDSPCEIKLHSGSKSLVIRKTGFFDLVETAEIKAFRTTNISSTFKFAPSIKEISNIPFEEDFQAYSLVKDGTGQSLINSSDLSKKTLAYFPKEILEATIFGNKSAALINSPKGSYKVNLSTNESVLLADLPSITFGKFSHFGDYFAFTSPTFPEIWMLNNNEALKLNLSSGDNLFSWSALDKLYYFKLVGEDYILGSYDPKTNQYLEIKTFANISPDTFLISANEKFAYFTSGEKYYEIQLK
ncbi:hypothetical protein COU74_05220 [Candidatus Peregrinibacteria bacterium CG10_big_fil_rev_8_21_14_0_10_36_19]|nr:MAG: hypothetical protein COU74_05220 [Candidatus Peregrinibacteria bacterium CG10_big_fil_rev_8_21_14_0_10_36_19]